MAYYRKFTVEMKKIEETGYPHQNPCFLKPLTKKIEKKNFFTEKFSKSNEHGSFEDARRLSNFVYIVYRLVCI